MENDEHTEKVVLDELDGEGGLANTTATNNDNFILSHDSSIE